MSHQFLYVLFLYNDKRIPLVLTDAFTRPNYYCQLSISLTYTHYCDRRIGAFTLLPQLQSPMGKHMPATSRRQGVLR
ncbi:hypothetical protein Y032_0302g1852 [Ancylostoma ceylanicum]|uniref:Uncharacterized protein n=1 Tax=Ancylostoma ceylanicum TaxID=53326 RepID=A0A016S414_9BILA|nr:hypothetical protein Y032_0302g1852 [Ancylostoma ceylanicum]